MWKAITEDVLASWWGFGRDCIARPSTRSICGPVARIAPTGICSARMADSSFHTLAVTVVGLHPPRRYVVTWEPSWRLDEPPTHRRTYQARVDRRAARWGTPVGNPAPASRARLSCDSHGLAAGQARARPGSRATRGRRSAATTCAGYSHLVPTFVRAHTHVMRRRARADESATPITGAPSSPTGDVIAFGVVGGDAGGYGVGLVAAATDETVLRAFEAEDLVYEIGPRVSLRARADARTRDELGGTSWHARCERESTARRLPADAAGAYAGRMKLGCAFVCLAAGCGVTADDTTTTPPTRWSSRP